MPDKTNPDQIAPTNPTVNESRRRLLLLLPFGIFATVAGTIAAAAFRFLRPIASAQQAANWVDAIPTANVKGDKPLMCAIMIERSAGWSTSMEEQQVFILPAKNRQAISSACPHEGCNVMWRDESNDFFCPCHDSSFAPDGARLTGPAPRGLDPLPSRENGGMIQVQYQTFVNNSPERIPRA